MVDWCRPLDRPDAPHLYQVGVEYLHSRTRDKAARDVVEAELTTVRNAAAAYLDRVGISHRPDGDSVFRTYFINNRGDEALGSTWSYLDMTALGRQEEWEDSPEGYPQAPPYGW